MYGNVYKVTTNEGEVFAFKQINYLFMKIAKIKELRISSDNSLNRKFLRGEISKEQYDKLIESNRNTEKNKIEKEIINNRDISLQEVAGMKYINNIDKEFIPEFHKLYNIIFNDRETYFIKMSYIKGVTLENYLDSIQKLNSGQEKYDKIISVIHQFIDIYQKFKLFGTFFLDLHNRNILVRETDNKLIPIDMGQLYKINYEIEYTKNEKHFLWSMMKDIQQKNINEIKHWFAIFNLNKYLTERVSITIGFYKENEADLERFFWELIEENRKVFNIENIMEINEKYVIENPKPILLFITSVSDGYIEYFSQKFNNKFPPPTKYNKYC